ncbi:MAG: tRNA (N6-isopentenyl adenosine(37)-C2)-methylthiotransferase MiaB [Clostridia bacterium]|nr:tRNA (N6-isopentenyl adenosine(37)-C2)-methylthiotransferase MiaB [Clostridia bacterium]
MKTNQFISQNELDEQKRIALALSKEIEPRGLTFFVETFGCQMNVRDSETIKGWLCEIGYTEAEDKESADFILFNTCCVRDHAEKRLMGNIGALKELKDARPGTIIGVCGCMMQQEGVAKKLLKRFPHVSLVFGTNVLHRFPSMLQSVLNGERIAVTDRADDAIAEGLPKMRDNLRSAFVNIMYGCDNYCSYCIVPYVRGRERSRRPEDVKREIVSLVSSGISEITLLGQNVNSYGNDGSTGMHFADLLRYVSDVPGLRRIRFMSSHPKDLNDDVIRAIAEIPNVCHHVHLPVQSGNNEILKRMNRRYTREHYLSIVQRLREAVPDIEFTTDIIVGFPGETEEAFNDTMSLVKEVGFAAAFTFAYSPRQGTVAARMEDQIPESVKKQRLSALNTLQAEKTVENNEKYIGHVGEVLVEGCDCRGEATMLYGKYPNFKMVYFPGDPILLNRYVTVKVTKTNNNSLLGEMIHA